MKWLYRILRLFFCPHKFETISTTAINGSDDLPHTRVYRQECKFCGKPHIYRIKA